MVTDPLEAAQQKLARLLEQKKALEAKISREQGLLRERERKARTRRLIEFGGLVAVAGLDQETKDVVLGLLLDGARRLQEEPQVRQRWQALGVREFATRAILDTTPRSQESEPSLEGLIREESVLPAGRLPTEETPLHDG
jgi:conjugative transfer protein TraD